MLERIEEARADRLDWTVRDLTDDEVEEIIAGDVISFGARPVEWDLWDVIDDEGNEEEVLVVGRFDDGSYVGLGKGGYSRITE